MRMHVKTVQRRDLVIQEIRALSSILFYVAYDLCFDRGILGIGTSKDHLRSIAVSILEHDESMRHSRCHSSTCFTQACINLCKSYEISNRSLLGQICKSLEFLCKSASLCITMHDFLISGSSIGQSRDSWCRAKVSAARNCPSSGPSLVKVRGRLEKRFHNIS